MKQIDMMRSVVYSVNQIDKMRQISTKLKKNNIIKQYLKKCKIMRQEMLNKLCSLRLYKMRF